MSQLTNLTLRRISNTDVPTIANFECEIAKISFPDNPVTDVEFYSKKLKAAIQDRKSWPMVAEFDDEIIGWVWFTSRENFVTREVYADFRSFYVVSEKRGGGSAFQIMHKVIAECRKLGFTRIVGRTAATNVAMQAVYLLYRYQPQYVVYELDLASVPEKGVGTFVDYARPVNAGLE